MNEKDPHLNQDRYMLRMPDGMRERIRAAASSNGRSMNSEIIATLEEKYPEPRGLTFEEIQGVIDSISAASSEQERAEKIVAGNRILAASGFPLFFGVRNGVVQMMAPGGQREKDSLPDDSID